MEKKFNENGGFVAPKMTVMQPVVINVDGPSESVASKGFDPEKDHIEGFTKERVVDGYATFTDKPVSRDPEDELNIAPEE